VHYKYEEHKCLQDFVVKRKGKRPPGSCRFVYEYNIKKDVVGAVWGNVDCIRLAQNSNN